ncbi:MAG: hypothetical protein AAB461_00500 [Patescibacteria group bacterium]
MSLFSEILENIGICETSFPPLIGHLWNEELKENQRHIMLRSPGAIKTFLTFYAGDIRLYKLEIFVNEKMLASQTYSKVESWAFDKRKKCLVLLSNHGKTEISLT